MSGLDGRVAEVTEALANGYVRALRDRTLAEQESIRRAELDAQRIISDQLRHQATHDPLTGLPNRAAVFGRLAAALEAGRDTRAGLCYLDLDGFKAINDRYGHEAGDELLVTVARRIGETARGHGALAGRIGGDEFVVVAEVSPGIGRHDRARHQHPRRGEPPDPAARRAGLRLGVRGHRRVRGGLARVRVPDRRRRRRPLPGQVQRARPVGGVRHRPRYRAAAGKLTVTRPGRGGDHRRAGVPGTGRTRDRDRLPWASRWCVAVAR